MHKYTIRIYGIWINENQEVLLSDERIGQTEFTKFPGGGMEAGEGPIECLKREWQEEQGIEIEVLEHFYTTDFFQLSAFHKDTQVMSIYYLVKPKKIKSNPYSKKIEAFDYAHQHEELFRWRAIELLKGSDLTFPIDKKVATLIKEKWPTKSEP
jgi:mutator protein MutT